MIAPGAASLLLAGAASAALLTTRVWLNGVFVLVFLVLVLQVSTTRRWPYLLAALVSSVAVFVLSPLLAVTGTSVLWSGPVVPVLGVIDVTSEEIREAAFFSMRLAAVSLAFAIYA